MYLLLIYLSYIGLFPAVNIVYFLMDTFYQLRFEFCIKYKLQI